MPVQEESCSRHCGYYDHGQDLFDHERYEHRPCPHCGAGEDQDLRTYSLTHRLDCIRLQSGHTYSTTEPGYVYNGEYSG